MKTKISILMLAIGLTVSEMAKSAPSAGGSAGSSSGSANGSANGSAGVGTSTQPAPRTPIQPVQPIPEPAPGSAIRPVQPIPEPAPGSAIPGSQLRAQTNNWQTHNIPSPNDNRVNQMTPDMTNFVNNGNNNYRANWNGAYARTNGMNPYANTNYWSNGNTNWSSGNTNWSNGSTNRHPWLK